MNTLNDLVSIIIPNYNKALYLEQCIMSVVEQTYRPIEIIVVDDCSTDSSLDLLEKLKNTVPELIVIVQDKNAGVSTARNVGIKSANGLYVTMLDSDDYYYNPQKLSNEMSLIKNGYEFAYSKIVRVDNSGNVLPKQFLDNNLYLQGDVLASTMLGKNLNTIPRDYIISRKLALDCGGYPEGINLYEDLIFLIQLLSRVEVACTYETGTAYRQDTNGLSKHPLVYKYRLRWRICWSQRRVFHGYEKITFSLRMLFTRLKGK